MRGYLSFVLVLASLALLFSLLDVSLAAADRDFSRAVAVERAYGVQMNAKEAVLESARQGGMAGFGAYDQAHDLAGCAACPDHGCMLAGPAACNAAVCQGCFRENEARQAAEEGAAAAVAGLAQHQFAGDFSASVGAFSCGARLAADPAARNLFSLDSLGLRQRVAITVRSGPLGVSANASLPQGMVILYG